ncbi:MAG: helix-turn-helix domain-containing protein [Candidatus Eisenbacteria bacterium]|uniref:Helix-turn-helix domain-containing protein n=1 Tax=Eiseniibacteriota bacterium TaxID=2212470 RepID=A0A948RYL7_UNCEI|nr:helix-turn-helix domain-containing protein [Candidatus Eisenbacteria bacterium]MBU1950040.1 helix-turn-helix domain-containing protein [Candidatus Eisenbacteria bacterium]MBU2691997.1 helix-turn-helix domain-containing protein [Candidatus Eisenbacteria bacterium]
MNDKQLLRPADIAPLLGVTTGRVYQLIDAGVIPATKMGGSIRIPREAWELWLQGQSDVALDSIKVNRPGQQPQDQIPKENDPSLHSRGGSYQ